jgi:hypothetical protein
VLRELDDDGHLGLRDAPGLSYWMGCAKHTRGFPRALEAVKAILDGDPHPHPRGSARPHPHLPEDRVVEVLVGEAYQLLDRPAQQVMQALSVFPAPVSSVGVDFLLQPGQPHHRRRPPILTRLVPPATGPLPGRQLPPAPVDRDYARGQIRRPVPATPRPLHLAGLQDRRADYYAQIRTPRESWRSLADVRPQLAEFELRCDTGDYDTAADVSPTSTRLPAGLGPLPHPARPARPHHGRITKAQRERRSPWQPRELPLRLGDYPRAIELHTQALNIDREIGNREGEAAA